MRCIFVFLALIAGPALGDLRNNDDGTVSEPEGSLVWTAMGNGEDINFPDARDHCAGLGLAARSDWRLPTLEEAKSLYRPDKEPRNSYEYRGKSYPLRIDDAFSLTAPGIWTSSASYRGVPTTFLFSSGRDFSWRGEHSNFSRVLCVRQR